MLTNNVHYNVTAVVLEGDPMLLDGKEFDHYELRISNGDAYETVPCTGTGLNYVNMSAIIVGNPTPKLSVHAVYRDAPDAGLTPTPMEKAMTAAIEAAEGNPKALEALQNLQEILEAYDV